MITFAVAPLTEQNGSDFNDAINSPVKNSYSFYFSREKFVAIGRIKRSNLNLKVITKLCTNLFKLHSCKNIAISSFRLFLLSIIRLLIISMECLFNNLPSFYSFNCSRVLRV